MAPTCSRFRAEIRALIDVGAEASSDIVAERGRGGKLPRGSW